MDIAATRRPDRQQLFETHYGLAVSLAHRYATGASWAVSIEDLTQVALLGLLRAIGRYDPERGVPFSAFATTSVVGELKHYLRDRSWAVRPSRRVQDLYLRSLEAIGDLSQELGRSPTAAEIGERLDASPDDVGQALGAGDLRRPASLDAPCLGDGQPLSAHLACEDRGMAGVDARVALGTILTRLPEREQRMIRLRYLDGLTQHQIAQRMSLSQAHVQRLLVRSLGQLRALAAAS